ncbi:hypothetical protein [Amycolatopsis orientalis]|uniref:hypothetical protein n=1 Tax=Amycolatopsis orientalis TaxID=31958 RepID=UPI0003A51CB6|nr:hypothetical protein [Amycolatopsis orientalis]
MPDANPLVAESKKDGDGPGPFTEGNGDYGYATGINIAESATDAWKGIADGDWVSGGLGVASLAGEIAGAAIDPFGYLMSSVASFLMEHVQPLKDMLDSVAGNPPVIQSYADTWGNVAKSLQERQKDLENAVKTGTAEWKGDGADAYRKSAAEAAEAIGGAATVASAIGTVTMVMGQVVAFVRGLVRQLIADLVGKLISWVMEEVFSLGFGTPLVVAQAVTAISKWGEKISELLTKLCETMRRVSPLLGKLAEVFTKIIKVLGKLAGKVTGLDVISTKNIKAGGFFHRGGSGGGAGGSGGGHHSGSGGEGDADPGSPSGSRRSNGSDNADDGDGLNGSPDGSDGSDTPGDPTGDSGGHNGSDSPSSDSPLSPDGLHPSSPDGTGPSTIDTLTSSSRRSSDSPGGIHPDSGPSALADDASPTSHGGGSPSESSYSPQSPVHSDGPSPVSAPHSNDAPRSPSGGGTHSGGDEPSPHHSSSNDSTSASGYAPPRPDAPAPESAPPPHLRSNDGGGSAPNQAPAGGGIPQQGGGGPTNAPAGGGSPSPRPSGSGWTGTPGSRAPEAPPNRAPDSGPSSRRPSPADGGGPSRTPDRSGPGPQRSGDGSSATPPQRTGEGGSSAPQRTGDGGSASPRTGDATSPRPDGGGGSSPQRPADSSNSGPQRPGDGGETGPPKRPGAEPGLGRSEPAPASGGSPASGNRGSGDGSAPPAAAVATGPGGGQRGSEGGARRPDGSPEPVARGGARTDAPAKPGETNGSPRTGKETPAQYGKPKNGDKPEGTAPDKKPARHNEGEGKPGGKADHKPEHDAPERKPDHADPEHQDPKHHDPDGSNHHDEPGHDGTPPHHDEPLSPDEVNHRHAEDTPAGSSYHRDDPELGDLPHRVQPDPDGRYTVDVHVTADGHARIGDRLYTPEEFADILRHNGNYDGRPIRLIGCDAGSNDFAHRLSRDLDTEVLAPSKPAWTDANGRVFSSNYEIGPDGRMRPRIPPDGEWSVHRPDGSAHHVGDDGFAPDGKHHDPHDIDADSAVDRGQPPFNQEQRDQDMRDLRQENRDRRAEGLDGVRELNGNRNPLTDDVRRPHERALTTARFRDANGETVDLYSFSGKSHDWTPAKDGPEWPKSERLFGTKDAGPYRPELGMPDPDGKFGRTHDSEPKLLEEMVRHNFAARSGLDRAEIDDIVKKEIEKSRREEAAYLKNNHENMYREGLRGDTARARDRMDGALEEINRRGAERAQQNGQTYTPVTREDISGDLRMVVDLPSTKRDMIPNEYQICDSCTDVILQYKQLFPNVRVEVVNLAGERLM